MFPDGDAPIEPREPSLLGTQETAAAGIARWERMRRAAHRGRSAAPTRAYC